LAFALLAVSLFIYSPWHRHDRIATPVCEFSQFEHGSLNGPANSVQLAPPVLCSFVEPAEPAFESLSIRPVQVLGLRAPPTLPL
jgi:hypothetical protein